MAALHGSGPHVFDATYLTKLKERDAAIEAHFFSYFNLRLQAKIRKRVYSSELIKDVCQETLFRVFTAIHSERGVRKPESLGAFVHSVCNNVLSEFGRTQKRYCALEHNPTEPPDETVSAEQILLCEESRSGVHKTLLGLSMGDRELLQSVFLEERDKEDMCRKLGIRRNSFRVRLHRAKRQFLRLHRRSVNSSSRIPPHSAQRWRWDDLRRWKTGTNVGVDCFRRTNT